LNTQLPISLVHPVWWASCDEFLPPSELDLVRDAALAVPDEYRPSGVMNYMGGGVDQDVRRSLVHYTERTIMTLFEERLLACSGSIFERLRFEPFPVRRVEIQLTRTGDGEYFKVHNDNTHNKLSSRRVSFVYYFHREPKRFSGGALRIFASQTDGRRWRETAEFVEIEPTQNRLVVFPSFLMHEVRPASAPSGRFEDGRFTVNGWFHA
jgi:Rps23 Pro-64 3,4-dihydroxylase Tpa1-like proline 4-hydroxylase